MAILTINNTMERFVLTIVMFGTFYTFFAGIFYTTTMGPNKSYGVGMLVAMLLTTLLNILMHIFDFVAFERNDEPSLPPGINGEQSRV